MSLTSQEAAREASVLEAWRDHRLELAFDTEFVVGGEDDFAARSVGKLAIHGWRGFWNSRWTRVCGPLALLVFWQLAVSVGHVSPLYLPSPSNVWHEGVTLVKNGTLIPSLGISARRAFLGLLLGLVIGSALALLSGLTSIGDRLIDPSIHMLRFMPVLALLPLFVIYFGIGEKAKVVIVAWAVIFPIYINFYAGIRSVDEKLVTAGRVLGLSRVGLIRHVILPGAMPQLLTGLRLAMGICWFVLVAAEEINATSGLGYLITNAENLNETNVIFVGLIVYALLGLTTDIIVRLFERWALAWRSSSATTTKTRKAAA